MSEHYIKVCGKCQKVFEQCRCDSKDKVIKYGICPECETKYTYSECSYPCCRNYKGDAKSYCSKSCKQDHENMKGGIQ
jgi:hypothetical protein